jgi:hypothetical protein
MNFRTHIDAGVEFLDRRIGRQKWLSLIDEKELDMSITNKCMGQVYPGGFWTMCDHIAEDYPNKTEYDFGFDINFSYDFSNYELLTRQWQERIEFLRMISGS